jgi:hypothetical protein
MQKLGARAVREIRVLRATGRGLETEPCRGLRRRQKAKAAGNSYSPLPVGTAPALDPTSRPRVLGLTATADDFDDLIAMATQKRRGSQQLIEHVVTIEEKERSRRGLERRRARGGLEPFKVMADVDWTWPERINRPLVESAPRLNVISSTRNIVLVAAQGLGQTRLAQNTAHQAILGGQGVLFADRCPAAA